MPIQYLQILKRPRCSIHQDIKTAGPHYMGSWSNREYCKYERYPKLHRARRKQQWHLIPQAVSSGQLCFDQLHPYIAYLHYAPLRQCTYLPMPSSLRCDYYTIYGLAVSVSLQDYLSTRLPRYPIKAAGISNIETFRVIRLHSDRGLKIETTESYTTSHIYIQMYFYFFGDFAELLGVLLGSFFPSILSSLVGFTNGQWIDYKLIIGNPKLFGSIHVPSLA